MKTTKNLLASGLILGIGTAGLVSAPAQAAPNIQKSIPTFNAVQAKATSGIKASNTNLTIKATVSKKVAKTTANLNLRQGASTKHKVLTVLKKGSNVTVLKTSKGWSQVKAGNKTGWVASNYLTAIKNTKPTASNQTKKSTSTKYSTANLNMRTGAGTSHKVISVLKKNTKVTVLKNSGSWSQVKTGNKTGWVSNKYLSSKSATTIHSKKAPSYVLNTDTASSNRTDIIKNAKKHVGAPYRFGGTSPKTGWDCSGYLQYVFNESGVKIPRTKAWNGLKQVSKSQAKPGDMVVQYGGGHVGIYAGNNKQYHAANPTTDTVYSNVWDKNAKYYSVGSIL